MNRVTDIWSLYEKGVQRHREMGLEADVEQAYRFYEGDQWISALVEADSYDWTEAIKYWIKLADTNNEARRSCAAYNIATACYMLGYYDLALKWLDMSDKGSRLSLSAGLRKRINARK